MTAAATPPIKEANTISENNHNLRCCSVINTDKGEVGAVKTADIDEQAINQ